VKVRVVQSRRAPSDVADSVPASRVHAPAHTVKRQQLPYWSRAWVRQGREYSGTYQTPFGAFAGWICEGSETEFYIYQPPEAIRHHSHWPCFQPRRDGWYLVHMVRRPGDVSSGIMTIERLLTEAQRDYGK